MRLKYFATSLLCLTLCLSAIGCKEKEIISKSSASSAITEKTEISTTSVNTEITTSVEPVNTEPADTTPPTDGIIESDIGSTADYVGLYKLTSNDSDLSFDSIEIPENNSEYMYLYKDDIFITYSYIDYSEQRALDGNALMEIYIYDDVIGIFPFSTDSTSELEMEINGTSETFEKVDGKLVIINEDEASDYLFDFLKASGYNLDGTAIRTEFWDENLGLESLVVPNWFFVWGKNDAEKFTAEKRFCINSIRQVWEYDVLSDEWTICNFS